MSFVLNCNYHLSTETPSTCPPLCHLLVTRCCRGTHFHSGWHHFDTWPTRPEVSLHPLTLEYLKTHSANHSWMVRSCHLYLTTSPKICWFNQSFTKCSPLRSLFRKPRSSRLLVVQNHRCLVFATNFFGGCFDTKNSLDRSLDVLQDRQPGNPQAAGMELLPTALRNVSTVSFEITSSL